MAHDVATPSLPDPSSMALCHEWLTTFGGAEQVGVRLAETLGIRDIYVFAADPELAHRLFPHHRVHVHRWGSTNVGRRHWRWMLPGMPHAWKSLDLSRFDMVITSSFACTNAIMTRPDAYHVSYCHSPMRYAWNWQLEKRRLPTVLRPAWQLAAPYFRAADRGWADHVTLFIASSRNIARRIRDSYGRSSVVVHPPIDTDFWTPAEHSHREDFYLFAGRLVAFKRADIAVDAATQAGVKLVVAGSGPELERLRSRAGPGVEFRGQVPQLELRDLYRRARGLLSPGVDDFGMGMAEAQACGTPVIAFDAGGASEIVTPRITGVLYEDPSSHELARVLASFDPEDFLPEIVRNQSMRFDSKLFDSRIRTVIGRVSSVPPATASSDSFAESIQSELSSES